ncbi:MAG: DUF2892 domain-containing protein [Taibaiella sp.]|nr:DUF2892 domain-containing protein [Taibaiella sp.]
MNKEAPYNHRKLPANVSPTERALSALAGGALIYNALSGKNKLLKAIAGGYLLYRGGTGHCYAYSLLGKDELPDPVKSINIRLSITVNKPRAELYAFWRRLENLPLFMKHLESVREIDETRSKWKASMPGIGKIEWEAEIVKDETNKLIGWSSLPGARIENADKVTFEDTIGGTEIDVVITYRAPMGALGAGVAAIFTPLYKKMIEEDIIYFKRYIEAETESNEIIVIVEN